MAWFFVQVWVLCLVAFLLGSVVTWLAFVRPWRRADGSDAVGWPVVTAWPGARPATDPPPPRPAPEAGPPNDPALSALDVPATERHPATGPGAAATEALDRLGVGPVIPVQSSAPTRWPDIPAQPGPADATGR